MSCDNPVPEKSVRPRNRRCCKCDNTSYNSSATFHEFLTPGKTNIYRAMLWANWAFPDENWTTLNSLRELKNRGKVICSDHFAPDAFIEHNTGHLRRTAVPIGALPIKHTTTALERMALLKRKTAGNSVSGRPVNSSVDLKISSMPKSGPNKNKKSDEAKTPSGSSKKSESGKTAEISCSSEGDEAVRAKTVPSILRRTPKKLVTSPDSDSNQEVQAEDTTKQGTKRTKEVDGRYRKRFRSEPRYILVSDGADSIYKDVQKEPDAVESIPDKYAEKNALPVSKESARPQGYSGEYSVDLKGMPNYKDKHPFGEEEISFTDDERDDEAYIIVVGADDKVDESLYCNRMMEAAMKYNNETGDYCRLCLSEEPDMPSIFEVQLRFYSLSLDKVIGSCSGVKVSKGDGLSEQICQICISRVESIWAFREQCKHSDETMQELKKATKTFCQLITNQEQRVPDKQRKHDENIDDKELTEREIDDLEMDEREPDKEKIDDSELVERKTDEEKIDDSELDERKTVKEKIADSELVERKTGKEKIDDSELVERKTNEEKIHGSELVKRKIDKKIEDSKLGERKIDKKIDDLKLGERKIDKKIDDSKLAERKIDKKIDDSKLAERKIDKKIEDSKLGERKIDKKIDDSKLAERKIDKKIDDSKLGERKIDKKIVDSKLGERKIDKKIDDLKLAERKIDEMDALIIDEDNIHEDEPCTSQAPAVQGSAVSPVRRSYRKRTRPKKFDRFDEHVYHDEPKNNQRKQASSPSNTVCELCGKKLTSPEELDLHRIEHKTTYPYSCRLCDRQFKTEGPLVVHVKGVHGVEVPYLNTTITCSQCGEEVLRNALSDHYLLHKVKLSQKKDDNGTGKDVQSENEFVSARENVKAAAVQHSGDASGDVATKRVRKLKSSLRKMLEGSCAQPDINVAISGPDADAVGKHPVGKSVQPSPVTRSKADVTGENVSPSSRSTRTKIVTLTTSRGKDIQASGSSSKAQTGGKVVKPDVKLQVGKASAPVTNASKEKVLRVVLSKVKVADENEGSSKMVETEKEGTSNDKSDERGKGTEAELRKEAGKHSLV